jgi:RNA polymerase sigma-70 factor (ECF subfamily)
MVRLTDERAVWLGKEILPHEAALRLWLQHWKRRGLEVDDVIQEAYTRLIAADSIEHIKSPKRYLFQVAGSVVIDHLRRRKIVSVESLADMADLEIAAAEPSPEREVIGRDELRQLAKALAALPSRIRDVFVLRRVHGLGQREVAKRLGITESTVEKHMSRGFMLMTKIYGNGGNPSLHSSYESSSCAEKGNNGTQERS